MTCSKDECPYKDVISDHEIRIRGNENNKVNIVGIEKDIKYIIERLDPIALAVQELKNRPGKLWDVLITAIVAGGGTLLITTLVR